ncbi:hypothetical protein F1C76_15050 [Geodermatophilaceae bacterium NBWT11]|nr:hypothetical protein F1C76_15050 [Geodermatophilaceae bacterium NBWT11]
MGSEEELDVRSAVDREGIRALLSEVYDHGLLYHAFTPYMRDYELVITASSDPRLGRPIEYISYLFVNCVFAKIDSTVSPAIWGRSLDDELVRPRPDRTYDAFVWGVNWQPLYPAFDLADQSDRALAWTASLGIPFHQLELESNGHQMTVVFSELRVRNVAEGYTPFVVSSE